MATRATASNSGGQVPLGDATDCFNTPGPEPLVGHAPTPAPARARARAPYNHHFRSKQRHGRAGPPAADRCMPAVSEKKLHNTTGSQQASKPSSSPFNVKTHIGPWELGRTLGKGSSARVRLARHWVTDEVVAIKIVPKQRAHVTQAGSLTRLDQIDSRLPESVNGVRRMPLALEREVAILKLVEHPNIVKLYDIWENRDEIYLILELVENGNLLEFVNRNGALNEEQAVFVFRQIMSAVQYCHSYNICHRDLKPENILLKTDGQVKVADFGMAALHQNPGEQLWTSCGTPEYAAPEILMSQVYRGDRGDVWSLGVILFVIMAGCLPFDDTELPLIIAKAKNGKYEMPPNLSNDAKDLIHLILQVDPLVRISMEDMWKHPLVWKYGYLDELGGNGGQPPNVRIGKQLTPLDLAHIDKSILRQLRSMWHTLQEEDLAAKLVTNEPNDQKLFYWLLHSYRKRQLENYNPDLAHSPSDLHLAKPTNWSKRVSTRQFSQPRPNGHGRNASKFTVISNVADSELRSEAGAVRIYDPYKSSLAVPHVSHPKITIHHNSPKPKLVNELRSVLGSESFKASPSFVPRQKMYSARGGTAGGIQSPRSSMSSIWSSRQGTAMSVRANSGYRRKVSFCKVKKQQPGNVCRHSMGAGGNGSSSIRRFSARPATEAITSNGMASPAPRVTTQTPTSEEASRPWDSKPLPPLPPHAPSAYQEVTHRGAGKREARSHRKPCTTPLPGRIAHFPHHPRQQTPEEAWQRDSDNDKTCTVSAPAPSPTTHDNRGLRLLVRTEKTSRVVNSPSAAPSRAGSPVLVTESLNLRQRVSPSCSFGPSGAVDLSERFTIPDQQALHQQEWADKSKTESQGSSSGAVTKLRKPSRSDAQELAAQAGSSHISKGSMSILLSPLTSKKRSFMFPFWKSSKSKPKLSLADGDGWSSASESELPPVQQNWLARLFRARPAERYMCLNMSKREANKEVVSLLREWRGYGIKDIEVDKERNRVSARASAHNYFSMREVAFTCEIMTVIEHGKQNYHSIVRFTQENGAAASFNKVADTMNLVFANRQLLVTDKRKAKMMIKTLNS